MAQSGSVLERVGVWWSIRENEVYRWGIRESMGQPGGDLDRVSVWWSIRESEGQVGY